MKEPLSTPQLSQIADWAPQDLCERDDDRVKVNWMLVKWASENAIPWRYTNDGYFYIVNE